MKVAISHTRFSSQGGIEKYVHSLVLRLLEADHEVHLFVRRWEAYEHPGLFFHRVRALPIGEGLKALSFAYSSAARLKTLRFDVVHGFTKAFTQDLYSDGSGLAEPYLRFLHTVPLWRRITKFRPLMSFAYRHIERRRFAGPHAPRVLALSRLVQEQILSRYPHMADRVEVLYNPVDVDAYHPGAREQLRQPTREELTTDDGATVFLLVGNDFRRKGVSTALRALKYLPQHAVLWVVGHDERLREYQRFAAQLGVSVRFTGSQPDPLRYYASADAFLLPSRYDAFGQAGLEAFACGLPVIVSAAAGVSELIEESVNGYCLRNADSPRELGEHMLRLVDPSTRARMSEEARRTAVEHQWDQHFARVLQVYEEIRAAKQAHEHR